MRGSACKLRTGGWIEPSPSAEALRPPGATVSAQAYEFIPSDRDAGAEIEPGAVVRLMKVPGRPPPGAMNRYLVADEAGRLLGLVHGESLRAQR